MRRHHIAQIVTWILLLNLGVVSTAGAPSRRPDHREMNPVRVVGTLPCADSPSRLITSRYEPHVLYGLCDGEHDLNKSIVFRVDTTTMPEKITHIDVSKDVTEDESYADDKFVEVGTQRFARIYEESAVTVNAIGKAGLAIIDFGQKTLTHYGFSPLDSAAIGFTNSEGKMVKIIMPESPSDLVFMPETQMLFVSTMNHLTETDMGEEVIQPSTLLLYSLKTGKPELVGFGGAKPLLSRLALVGPVGQRSLALFHKNYGSSLENLC